MNSILTLEEHWQYADRFLDRVFMQLACCTPSLAHAVALFEEIVGNDEEMDGWYEFTRSKLLLQLPQAGGQHE